MSAIPSQNAAGSFAVTPEMTVQALPEGKGVAPAGSWQQAAEIFSAIANTLASNVAGHDQQSRAELIQKLDELEMKLRTGALGTSDSLRSALAAIEVGLRVWSGMPSNAALSGYDQKLQTGGQLRRATPSLAGFTTSPETNPAGKELASVAETPETAWELADFDRQGVLGTHQREGVAVVAELRDPGADARARQKAAASTDSLERSLQPLRGRQKPSEPAGITGDGVSEPCLPARIDCGLLDKLALRIEAAQRELTARLDAGLVAAANETNTLKDVLASAIDRLELAQKENQNQCNDAALEQEITNLAARLDWADEGFAALASLSQAISGLSAQLEETRRIVSNLPMAGGEPRADFPAAPDRSGPFIESVLREIADLREIQEDIWQRLHLPLTAIQQSVEEIAKAVRTGAGLHGSDFVPPDPFAPILTSLVQHRADASLGARAVRAGMREDFANSHVHAKQGIPSGSGKATASEASAASFLIEPGLGFPSLDDQRESREHGPIAALDQEPAASRTDFIAAARRAARTAQRELQGSGVRSVSDGGLTEPGSLSFGRTLAFCQRYWRSLIFGGALLLAAMGTYAVISMLPGNRASVLEFLKQFERGSIRPKPAASGTAPHDKALATQSLPRTLVPAEPVPSLSQANLPRAEAATGGGFPPLAVAAQLDPIAPAAPGLAANAATRFIKPAAGALLPATPAIAGSYGIVADTLGHSTAASNLTWPSYVAASTPTNLPPSAAFGPSPAVVAAPALEPARDLLEEAESGDMAAQFELAGRYAEGSPDERNYERAAHWYNKAAEQGLAMAEFRLASLYERGLGVAKDMQRAKNLYQRAAEKGNTRAMHNLGVLAVESEDGKPNYTSAALWFGKAAEYGIRDSQYNLAVLLARGLGAPKDLVKSYTWFAIVAVSGDTDATKKRDEIAARLTSSELAAANAAAAAFQPRAADGTANEVAPRAARREAVPTTQGKLVKPKLSGL
ncbi:MAG TPA: tetratricopeptide repeat protein [Methylocella sp.]|nr:tetratricopeptide repeat protein [Methylocella sp.]